MAITLDSRLVEGHEVEERYVGDSVGTAPPGVLLVMVYDRLESDLIQADAAFDRTDLESVHRSLMHAWEVVRYLRATLVLDAWEAAPKLAALYDFIGKELVQADAFKDRERVARIRPMVSQLAMAWRKAAEACVESPTVAPREVVAVDGLA
jgi:flagellar protein FliS